MGAPKDPARRAKWVATLRAKALGRQNENSIAALLTSNNARKGKTHAEIFGLDRAEIIKTQLSKPRPKLSPERRVQQRLAMLGRVITWGDKISLAKKGIPQSPEHKRKNLEHVRATGARKTEERRQQEMNLPDSRDSVKYHDWAKAVKARDGGCCTQCGRTGRDIHAHHILPWEYFPAFRFDINNGVSVCRSCHGKEHVRVEGVLWAKLVTLLPTHEVQQLVKPVQLKRVKVRMAS